MTSNIQLFNMDCMEGLKTLSDESVDLVVTSPPYNFNVNGGGLGYKYKNYNDNLSSDEYFQWQKDVLNECLRVSKNGIFYNIQMIAGNKDALFNIIGCFYKKLKEIIIWNKLSAEPAINENVLNSQFEFILIFSKNNKRQFDLCNFKRGTLSNVWDIPKNYNKDYPQHSALMPEKLASRIIINFSKEDDLILDPFAGLATTGVSCIKNKRNFIGYEIDKEYYDAAVKRLENHKRQGQLF